MSTATLPVTAKSYWLERCPLQEAQRLADGSVSLRWILSPGENQIVASLKTPKRRQDWLAGRLAAKRLIAQRLEQEGLRLALSEIEIRNKNDRSPYVYFPTRPDLAESSIWRYPISLTHSASGGAAALAQPGHLIGIDLEAIAPRPPAFLSLLAHETEKTVQLQSLALEQTRLWTLKEAVSKLLSLGLSVDLWDIRFVPDQSGQRLELHGKARTRWEGLGRPPIFFLSHISTQDILSIACTGGLHG